MGGLFYTGKALDILNDERRNWNTQERSYFCIGMGIALTFEKKDWYIF